jgi:hypothetical protein
MRSGRRERSPAPGRRWRRWALAAGLALFAVAGASGRVFKTMEEALTQAYPGLRVERRAVYFTDVQRRAITRASGARFNEGFTAAYELHAPTGRVGVAYFEIERVRTHAQTAMIVVGPDRKIDRFEVIAYHEPIEYLPRPAWYERLRGHALDDRLRLGRGVDGVTGATLSSRAAVRSARQALAIHQAIFDAESEGEKQSVIGDP